MIYVGQNMPTLRSKIWKYDTVAHLYSDPGSQKALVKFAKKIGLLPEWLRVSSSGIPHFDLTRGKRVRALEYGAKELSTLQEGRKIQEWILIRKEDL
jgi:hypothetical protein